MPNLQHTAAQTSDEICGPLVGVDVFRHTTSAYPPLEKSIRAGCSHCSLQRHRLQPLGDMIYDSKEVSVALLGGRQWAYQVQMFVGKAPSRSSSCLHRGVHMLMNYAQRHQEAICCHARPNKSSRHQPSGSPNARMSNGMQGLKEKPPTPL